MTPISAGELQDQFGGAGIESGDCVIIHSSLRSLGDVQGGADALIDCLLSLVGPSGNLMFPTFNYTRPLPNPYYDPRTTPCKTGMLNEVARKRSAAVRSLHPTHSVAVIGPDADWLTREHLSTRALGVDSPIDRIARKGGKVLLIGVGQTSNSTIHVAEEYAGIPKSSWYDPLPKAMVLTPSGKIIEHTLDESPSCSAAFESAEYRLHKEGVIRYFRVRGCLCRLMNAQRVIEVTSGLLKREPDALLCNWPQCVPCAGTRKNIAGR